MALAITARNLVPLVIASPAVIEPPSPMLWTFLFLLALSESRTSRLVVATPVAPSCGRRRLSAADRRFSDNDSQQTEVFYHSLVETIPQMILCKDLEGRFTFANQKFCAELGHTLEDIKGKTDLDFFPKELAEKYRRDDKDVLERASRSTSSKST